MMVGLGTPRFVPYAALARHQISLSEGYLMRLTQQGVLQAGIHYCKVGTPGARSRGYHWNPTAIRHWQRSCSSLQRCPKS